MVKSLINWTILPNGTNGKYQQVSVVVSPRLTPDPENQAEWFLDAFPDFLKWPDVVEGASFSAETGGNMIKLKLVSAPDPKLWHKLFGEETPVSGFQYEDMSKARLHSYSIRNILGYLKKYYSRLAVESPSELPRLLPWDEADSSLKDMLKNAGTPEKPQAEPPGSGFSRFFDKNFVQPAGYDSNIFRSRTEYDLYLADRFYRRTRPTDAELRMRRPDFENIPEPPEEPEYDFHRIIAALADYPEIMRRLGLVLDFIVAEPIKETEGRLRLHVIRKGQEQADPDTDVTPWTAFLAGGERFITRPRTNDQKDGLLNLHDSDDSYKGGASPFDIYQVDPDGAALKTVDFTITAQSLIEQYYGVAGRVGGLTYATGDRQGLAALRSGGLGVSRHERAVEVAADLVKMTQNDTLLTKDKSDDIVLFAEDVFRGYRVDVADDRDPGLWRTLCARLGDYSLTKGGETIASELSDEGYVAGVSTTAEKADSMDQYLHESLFRWTGWSLCVPRPGRALKAEDAEDGSHIQREVLIDKEDPDDAAGNGCGVNAAFTAKKGSLPRLRFGHEYRFRARIVDIAGNSLAVDAPPPGQFTGASKAVGYWRFEPVDPPVLVQRDRVSEGESLERMVIRSNYNATPGEYLRTEPFATVIQQPPASEDFHYGAVNDRHFVPPKSSQQQCETHGLFDPYFGNWQKIREGYSIAAREEGTLYDGLEDPDATLVRLITPSALEGIATTEGMPEQPSDTNPVGDRMAGGQYVIHGKTQISTPWLPDGAAGGVAIRAAAGYQLPGVTVERELGESGSCVIYKVNGSFVILVSNKGTWPNSIGFRLILAEQSAIIDPSEHMEDFINDGEPVWDELKRTLTLFVPKGRIVRLVYSSFVHKSFIDSFGLPKWVQNEDDRRKVVETAVYGANWMITPYRELTLVHATQAPVFKPRFNQLNLHREWGSHDVKLTAVEKDDTGVRLHGPSTGKFEIEADWSEWVDDVDKPGPQRVKFQGKLGEIRLAENHANKTNLGDAVNAQIQDSEDSEDKQRADVHALGDTRFRLIRYSIRATTRFREYLPPDIYADPELVTQVGPVATGQHMLLPPDIDEDPGAPILPDTDGVANNVYQSCVPASSPPADPPVLYVIPTMRWQIRRDQTGDRDVIRLGNGLRVWLDRPWFSSGDGELLGVVISQVDGGSFAKIDPKFQSLITQWGRDPFWDSAIPKPQATETDFTARVTSEQVSLQENSSARVIVVGHRVHWDSDRRLWYCDIEFGPLTTYMPFVRLALVRYQPNAISGAKISKVVLTDFAQVLPRRRATVKVEGNRIAAALRGPNPLSGPMVHELSSIDSGRNRVELVLQTCSPFIRSDLAWKDEAVLVNQVVGSPALVVAKLDQPVVIEQGEDAATETATRAGRAVPQLSTLELSKLQRLQASLDTESLVKQTIATPSPAQPLVPPVFEILEDPFWEATATLPDATGIYKPRRLMLREFERFYKNASSEAARDVEERLIFADIIEL